MRPPQTVYIFAPSHLPTIQDRIPGTSVLGIDRENVVRLGVPEDWAEKYPRMSTVSKNDSSDIFCPTPNCDSPSKLL